MLTLGLPETVEVRLHRLAAATGRMKSFYVREALINHLEKMEDIYLPSLSKDFLIVNQEGMETDKWEAHILSKRKIRSSEESF